MKEGCRKHTAHVRVSVNERSSMVVVILLSVEGELQDIVYRQTVLGDGSRDGCCVPPFRDVFSLPGLDAASDGDH